MKASKESSPRHQTQMSAASGGPTDHEEHIPQVPEEVGCESLASDNRHESQDAQSCQTAGVPKPLAGLPHLAGKSQVTVWTFLLVWRGRSEMLLVLTTQLETSKMSLGSVRMCRVDDLTRQQSSDHLNSPKQCGSICTVLQLSSCQLEKPCPTANPPPHDCVAAAALH